jgi:hypothetical protein
VLCGDIQPAQAGLSQRRVLPEFSFELKKREFLACLAALGVVGFRFAGSFSGRQSYRAFYWACKGTIWHRTGPHLAPIDAQFTPA